MEECSASRKSTTSSELLFPMSGIGLHGRSRSGYHFESILIEPTPEQIAKIVEILSLKISIANECQIRIMEETNLLIYKIQRMSMQALDNIKEKMQRCARLLRDCYKPLLPVKMREIELELALVSSISIPSSEFKEIEEFFKFDFLKESDIITQIASMEIQDAKKLLANKYSLFLESHFNGVNSIALTSDNKYLISAGHDKTVRIWNFPENRQEAVLEGHTDSINCVAITSDSKYIASAGQDNTVRI